jgi:Ca-activated chloride channel family protein
MSDETKLTDYALDQLTASERAEVEARLNTSADDRHGVGEITRLTALLRDAESREPLPSQSTDLRHLVESRLVDAVTSNHVLDLKPAKSEDRPSVVATQNPRARRSLWLPVGLAASLLLVAVAFYQVERLSERLAVQSPQVPRGIRVGDVEVAENTQLPASRYTASGSTQVAENRLRHWQDAERLSILPDESKSMEFSDLKAWAEVTKRREMSKRDLLEKQGETNAPAAEQDRSGGGQVSDSRKSKSNVDGLDVSNGTRLSKQLPEARLKDPAVNAAPRESAPVSDAPRPTSSSTPVTYGGTMPLPLPANKPAYGPAPHVNNPVPALQVPFEAASPRTREAKEKAVELEVVARRLTREGLETRTDREKAPKDELSVDRLSERGFHTEAYDAIVENAFLKVTDNPLSTFSIDVDTASYSNMRRFLKQNRQLPPPGAVRLEEFINYFTYDYPQPKEDVPFSVTTEVADCPWASDHRLVRIGLKGREIKQDARPASNLVFLLDVSGSMQPENKLPLVKESMKLLTRQLTENDRVAIAVYAGASGLVLPSTTGDNKETIIAALDQLHAGGSTNGASGIELAYQEATKHFIKGGTNRVILATDGDFNVGVTSQDELVRLIEAKAKSGVFFTALGFGMGNLKDSMLEKLADKGNGNYAYIDDAKEAKKVLVEQLSGTLVTIAKDVKIQIEFNPARVGAFRLLGYENRVLVHEDFNNDKKDAGEIGAGHTVTALYELIPPAKTGAAGLPEVDPLKYQKTTTLTPAAEREELLTLKLRYKAPDADTSKLIETPVVDAVKRYAQASADFKFAAAVASFGMLLRSSEHRGNANYDAVLELAGEGIGTDAGGYRAEFVELVKVAKSLAPQK